MLGDRYTTVLFWKPQLALFVNATTLLPVFVPPPPSWTVSQALAVVLRAHGVAQGIIDRELAETAERCLTRTNSRSVAAASLG